MSVSASPSLAKISALEWRFRSVILLPPGTLYLFCHAAIRIKNLAKTCWRQNRSYQSSRFNPPQSAPIWCPNTGSVVTTIRLPPSPDQHRGELSEGCEPSSAIASAFRWTGSARHFGLGPGDELSHPDPLAKPPGSRLRVSRQAWRGWRKERVRRLLCAVTPVAQPSSIVTVDWDRLD